MQTRWHKHTGMIYTAVLTPISLKKKKHLASENIYFLSEMGYY